ncbi:MAG: hypothetical protein ABH891_09305 [Candidatus Omnitrophota bacterium]
MIKWDFLNKVFEPFGKLQGIFKLYFDELPNELKQMLFKLADRGWYPSLKFYAGTPKQILELIDNKKEEELEEFLKSFARSRIAWLHSSIQAYYPSREKIVKDAINAHNNGAYALSVPVFLAQADGISHEVLHGSIYSGQKEKKITSVIKNKIEAMKIKENSIMATWFILLVNGTSIGVSTKERDRLKAKLELYGPLNRHGVMHGLDLDYATEANSLRSMMVLEYMLWVSEKLRESRQK